MVKERAQSTPSSDSTRKRLKRKLGGAVGKKEEGESRASELEK